MAHIDTYSVLRVKGLLIVNEERAEKQGKQCCGQDFWH
jgi:hypothetical protein